MKCETPVYYLLWSLIPSIPSLTGRNSSITPKCIATFPITIQTVKLDVFQGFRRFLLAREMTIEIFWIISTKHVAWNFGWVFFTVLLLRKNIVSTCTLYYHHWKNIQNALNMQHKKQNQQFMICYNG